MGFQFLSNTHLHLSHGNQAISFSRACSNPVFWMNCCSVPWLIAIHNHDQSFVVMMFPFLSFSHNLVSSYD